MELCHSAAPAGLVWNSAKNVQNKDDYLSCGNRYMLKNGHRLSVSLLGSIGSMIMGVGEEKTREEEKCLWVVSILGIVRMKGSLSRFRVEQGCQPLRFHPRKTQIRGY